MWLASASAIAIALAPLGVLAESGPPASPLVFHGNVVINNEVYLAVLDLPADFVADGAGAQLVRDRILHFLHRAGYEIARVETAVVSGHILIDIDEGRVEKLVLSGQGSIQTVRLLLALSLPQNVFNRPYLERQIATARTQLGVDVESFELVPTGQSEHVGPQVEHLTPWIDDLGNFIGHPIIPPRADYELQIKFRHRDWSNGLGLTLGFSGIDGLRVGFDFRGEQALLPHDRWLAETEVEGKRRSRLAGGRAYLALEGAHARLGWLTPPLAGGLRPMLALDAGLASHQRPDLGLENYTFTRTQLGLALSYDVLPGAATDLGLGAERRDIFALQRVSGATVPPRVHGSSASVPYIRGGLDIVFDTDEIRRDRHHEVKLDGRYYPGQVGGSYEAASFSYQRVFTFGWHDLLVQGRGDYLSGAVPFIEEQSVGGYYARGVFGRQFYTRRAVGATVEGRFSLTRDLYKVGFFADSAVFGQINETTNQERARGVLAVGPSYHALIADAFQLDLYYAFGFTAGAHLDSGFLANLSQAF